MHITQTSSTREKVLEIIKREKQATVKELTHELGITPMAIRGHLSKLENDNMIAVSTVRQKLGRPLQVFSLTNKGESRFPKQYGNFAVELLNDVERLDDGGTLNKLIQMREERIIEERLEFLERASTKEKKLKLYCELISKLGQMPELKKISENNFLLNINNCALLEIATSYPFCCDSEKKIITEVFSEAKVTQLKNIINSDNCCSYQFEF
ncbi:MAG: winged helix-turn-helix transcriptional regulator [Deltaproteobacteria bacterium]|nr:winged helix-turn-helix transcriptional regulator [Deltaproteobacteria bacterium]